MRRIPWFLYSLLVIPLLCIPIHADSVSVSIPVEITGITNAKIEINSDLEAIQYLSGDPVTSISRTGSIDFCFDKPVDVVYTVKQLDIVDTTIDQEYYVLDPSEYTVHVFVKTSENGDLIPETIVYKSDSAKSDCIRFNNQITKKGETVNTGDSIMNDRLIGVFVGNVLMILGILLLKKSETHD